MKLAVRRAGFLSAIQDLGRPGYRASGVTVGGALDPHALKVANLLVGNEPGAAGIEVALGNLELEFSDQRLIAWCGGEFDARIGDLELSAGRAGLLANGERFSLAAREGGGRAWLAISGGVDVPLVLGSRSTDLRSGFGGHEGPALRDGDLLPLGSPSWRSEQDAARLSDSIVANHVAPREWAHPATSHGILRVVRGAQWNCFEPAALLNSSFSVTAASDRMGVRLEGPKLSRLSGEELLSEAVAPGTIQVPPAGQPILLLGDCQTIGGYPKIAHVITVDLAPAAQLQPGDEARFAEVSLAEAQALLIERERDLERFRIGLALQTS